DDLLRIRRPALEHLAPKAEHDQALRRLELKNEPSFGEALRLLELVGRHWLFGDLPNLCADRRHRVVDPVDVETGLSVERSAVGVAVIQAVEVVGESAPLAPAGERP